MLDQQTKALLPTIISDAMDALSKNTNAPDEMTLPITLALATVAAQALSNIECMAWPKCTLSEYFMVLAPSGGLKTSLMDSVCEGVRRFEREQKIQADQDETDYIIQIKLYEAAIKEEVKNPVGATIVKPEPPRGYRYLIGKATTNGLIDTLAQVPYAGIFSSDAGELFNSHSFQDSSKSLEFISMLSKAWSGEDIDRVTGIRENNVLLHNRRLSMLVMLQQQLAGLLNNSQFKDQGVTNRMLITQCELSFKKKADFSVAGQQETDNNNARLIPFNERIYELLKSVDQNQQIVRYGSAGKSLGAMRARMGHTNINELELRTLKFSSTDGARQLMEDFYNEMADLSMDKKYEEYSNFLSRAYEHCCRLAGVLTVFDQKTEVSIKEVQCAIGLVWYFIGQRMTLTVDGNVRSSPVVECATALWSAMEKNIQTDFAPRELIGICFAYKKTEVALRQKVLDQLISDGRIEVIEVDSLGTKKKHVIRKV